MSLDVLILNSGEWILAEELAAAPWHVLIYRQRGEGRNELHLWLPRQGVPRSADFAFKRYWSAGPTRWCVEVPADLARPGVPTRPGPARLRFTSPEGRVLWVDHRGHQGLGDLSNEQLLDLLDGARVGPYTGP